MTDYPDLSLPPGHGRLIEETEIEGGKEVTRTYRARTREHVRTVVRHLDGTVVYDAHLRNGRLHREDGPAVITYLDDGTRRSEEWGIDGELHRIDGPADVLIVPAPGDAPYAVWHLWGTHYASSMEAAQVLAETPPTILRDEFARSGYAAFLDEGHSATAIVGARLAGVETIEGIRAVLEGAPPEWAKAFEHGAES